ncbi:MAG: hypothetical protein LBU42_00820 [Prevotellaceae bacterium]|jgi:uncharacterized protein (TIGR02145 family)|nr:hypothetical protein [Prevotellaceae bacterium]
MQTKLFFLAMLVNVAASAQTNVELLEANYTNKTVSFHVWWNAGSRDATHLPKVWVWVDYITVNSDNTTSGNSWTRAAVSAASPTASVTYDDSNRQGFWLQGNSGSYSATVTVQLNITASKFNWCAYVSDYPPNVTANSGVYTLRGTPPFTLTAANGTTTQTVSGSTISTSAVTITPVTLTDKTACSGVFCPYQGSDLFIDATHLCQQRTSGAKNWEAYIRDARDSKIYRIVQMPDGKWYFAQDLDYRNGSNHMYNASYCSTYIYGITAANSGTVCPSGWDVPTSAIWTQLITSINGAPSCWDIFWPTTAGGTDDYGFTAEQNCGYTSGGGGTLWRETDTGFYAFRAYNAKSDPCEQLTFNKRDNECQLQCITLAQYAYAPIRCVRQL